MRTKFNFFPGILTGLKFTILSAGVLLMLTTINSCEDKDDADEQDPDAYSLSDMEGTWQRHSLVTGINNQTFWIRGSIINSSDSSSTVNLILPNGTWDTVFNGANVSISSTGVITTIDDAHAHSYLSSDKKLMVGTTTRNYSYTLIIDQKTVPGTSYSISDFQGTWQSHYLAGGGEWSGWVHSTSTFDNSGNYSVSNVVRSDGGTNVSTGTLAISGSGVVTVTGFPSYHGFMSADKKLIVTNLTDGGGGGGLSISQKVVTGTIYNMADLAGTWQIHDILVGSEHWTEHGIITIDINGIGTLSNMVKDSGGSFNDPGPIEISITSEGVVSFGADFHGFLSADKKFMVGTQSDDQGSAFSLLAVQKMP